MTDNKPRDPETETDQDKPIAMDNADSHRPDSAGGPNRQSPPKDPVSAEGDVAKGRNQSDDAKLPPDSVVHKRQRSQDMHRH